MNTAHLTSIIEQRWNEAIANPTIPRWRTLAQMAALMASTDKMPEMADDLRLLSDMAFRYMLDLQPEREEA